MTLNTVHPATQGQGMPGRRTGSTGLSRKHKGHSESCDTRVCGTSPASASTRQPAAPATHHGCYYTCQTGGWTRPLKVQQNRPTQTPAIRHAQHGWMLAMCSAQPVLSIQAPTPTCHLQPEDKRATDTAVMLKSKLKSKEGAKQTAPRTHAVHGCSSTIHATDRPMCWLSTLQQAKLLHMMAAQHIILHVWTMFLLCTFIMAGDTTTAAA